MKPSNRILLIGLIIEVFLAALGVFLVMQITSGALTASVSQAEATTTITTVLGAVMGGLGGVLLVIFLVLRKRGS